MSRKVCVQFEVRDQLIMKDTLKEMGFNFSESGDRLQVSSSYGISIDCGSGNIRYDDVDERNVNKIKQQYTINYYRNKAIKEGMQLREERNAKGEVIITLSH